MEVVNPRPACRLRRAAALLTQGRPQGTLPCLTRIRPARRRLGAGAGLCPAADVSARRPQPQPLPGAVGAGGGRGPAGRARPRYLAPSSRPPARAAPLPPHATALAAAGCFTCPGTRSHLRGCGQEEEGGHEPVRSSRERHRRPRRSGPSPQTSPVLRLHCQRTVPGTDTRTAGGVHPHT